MDQKNLIERLVWTLKETDMHQLNFASGRLLRRGENRRNSSITDETPGKTLLGMAITHEHMGNNDGKKIKITNMLADISSTIQNMHEIVQKLYI